MQNKDLRLVRLALVVVCSIIGIVYLLLYQIKGDKILVEQPAIDSGTMFTGDASSGANIEPIAIDTQLVDEEELTGKSSTIKPTNSLFTNATVTGTQNTSTGKLILSGTTPYYGAIESADILGLRYEYALKDKKNIYYAYLGNSSYNFQENVKKLGGTTYSMVTEQEIMTNKLFGEKILFINLPEYKDKKVVMVIAFKKALWLIQIDAAIYHNAKSYIKSLFLDTM